MRDMIQRPDAAPLPAVPGEAAHGPAAKLDVRKYFFMIAKRLWLLLLCFMTAIVIMLVMMAKQVPEYQATTKIQLVRSVGIPSNLQQAEASQGDYVQTQRNIMLSREVIRRAREKLGLSPQEFGARFRNVAIAPVYMTSIMAITVTGLEPSFCANYANAIADAFLEYKTEEQSGSSQNTAGVLSQQANRLSEEITKMEESLLKFVRENSVVGIQERGNVAANLLAELSKQAAEYRTKRMLLEAQQPMLAEASDEVVLATLDYGLPPAAATRPPPAANAPPEQAATEAGAESLLEHDVVTQPRWDTLKRDNAILEAQLVNYRKKFKDEHPLIREALLKLQQNEDALKVEIQFALKQYYSQLEALNIKEKAATQVEQAWEEQALEIDRKQKEYEGLQRNLTRLQGLYNLIFNRLQEVDIAAGMQMDSVRILERAVTPGGPLKPRNLQSLFLAALIGLGVGIGLIFLLEFMDDSIRFPEEVGKSLGVPYLGLVPTAHWKQDSEAAYWINNVDSSSGFAEAYRNIRSALLLNPASRPFKTLTVTSSVPKEGKTTTSANLGTSFAQTGHKVLLVDADLHRGGLHRFFGLQAGVGLTDVLAGHARFDQVVQHTAVAGLDLVGTGAFADNPAELVLRREMKDFLAEAAKHYDLVIVDSPPVLAVSESTVIASQTDAVLLVVWSGRTSRKLVQAAVRQLLSRGAYLAGCVLNNLDLTQMGSYGASGYYHYYGYDYRYEEDNSAG